MGKEKEIPNGQHNSMIVNLKQNNLVNSEDGFARSGKSVEYTLLPDVLYWFPIRATYHRAQKVYDKLTTINDGRFELYLPMLRHMENNSEKNTQYQEEPLDKGLLFMRTTVKDFRTVVKNPTLVPGLTPYYDHFRTNEFGKNDFLVIPDRQMESFRIIVESHNENILVDQMEIPRLIEGDHVLVTGGPFAGVEGIVMKYKHQKRVFVQMKGVGSYATAYVPSAWLKKVESFLS